MKNINDQRTVTNAGHRQPILSRRIEVSKEDSNWISASFVSLQMSLNKYLEHLLAVIYLFDRAKKADISRLDF